MTARSLFSLLLLLVPLCPCAETVAWRNALWFDGTRFVPGTKYSVDGAFVARAPVRIDRTVELGERHVVPAYGEAHHHGIDSAEALDDKITVFLEAGIFYVKNPNVIAGLITPEVRARLARPDSIEVVFANGGLTSPGGHPVPLHEYLASLGVFKGVGAGDLEDRAYFVVADEAALEAKWPHVLAAKPDFIKAFLLFSEEYEGRAPLARETDGKPHKGLDPKVLAAVVRKAHAAKLRVSTHVDTARDFANAVAAGVDEINHLPQPDQRFSPDLSAYVISPEVARLARSKGITVVTTASTTERLSPSLPAGWIGPMRANQAANLKTLREAGVKIAIGSDGISGERRFVTARDEVNFLVRHAMMDPLTLLRAWSVDTPKTIFPDRMLGELRDGFEANFLVLSGDPLADSANLHRISMRVKGGFVLPPMPAIVLGR
ncbi:MAG: amidohydrolase family protein [Pseudomonadota bacterium]|nr:amidohydrolase family protein [Pseudomonadota bacterium]